jgi:hypothetical protein
MSLKMSTTLTRNIFHPDKLHDQPSRNSYESDNCRQGWEIVWLILCKVLELSLETLASREANEKTGN